MIDPKSSSRAIPRRLHAAQRRYRLGAVLWPWVMGFTGCGGPEPAADPSTDQDISYVIAWNGLAPFQAMT